MVVSNKYFQSMSLKIIIYEYRVEHEISRGQRENVEFYRKKTIIYNNLESNKSLSFNVN